MNDAIVNIMWTRRSLSSRTNKFVFDMFYSFLSFVLFSAIPVALKWLIILITTKLLIDIFMVFPDLIFNIINRTQESDF